VSCSDMSPVDLPLSLVDLGLLCLVPVSKCSVALKPCNLTGTFDGPEARLAIGFWKV
jgi:hypothetical protein